MLSEPVPEPRGEFGMALRPRPMAVLAHALHHILEAVEHESARADGGVEDLVSEGRHCKADHELPNVIGCAMQADVLCAARLGQCGLNGVTEQVGLEQAVFVQLCNEADNLAHVSAGNIVRKIRIAEDLLDKDELILNLGGEVAFPDLACLTQDMGVEREELLIERGENLIVGKRGEFREQ